MHVSFAEAQMIASDSVLEELDAMAQTLAGAYSRILRLEEGNPHPEGSFAEIQEVLLGLGVALGTDARGHAGRSRGGRHGGPVSSGSCRLSLSAVHHTAERLPIPARPTAAGRP
ncbi:hypothetical protein [Streptomyces sp. NPDC088762]|uniref:hypothetical protein n=1 Tax=Streptomyces sp. NPDC088762 TaxID=3365891 RepID=UPI0037F96516